MLLVVARNQHVWNAGTTTLPPLPSGCRRPAAARLLFRGFRPRIAGCARCPAVRTSRRLRRSRVVPHQASQRQQQSKCRPRRSSAFSHRRTAGTRRTAEPRWLFESPRDEPVPRVQLEVDSNVVLARFARRCANWQRHWPCCRAAARGRSDQTKRISSERPVPTRQPSQRPTGGQTQPKPGSQAVRNSPATTARSPSLLSIAIALVLPGNIPLRKHQQHSRAETVRSRRPTSCRDRRCRFVRGASDRSRS